MEINPLVILVAGLGCLGGVILVLLLNRKAGTTENPYDTPPEQLLLADALHQVRHSEALYYQGLELGRKLPRGRAEDVMRGLSRLGLGRFQLQGHSPRRMEVRVTEGPLKGAPGVDEPLCYFTLGLLTGVFETYSGREVFVREESCYGTGHPECIFNVEVTDRAIPST
ncbi:MAG TPA: V4R domain-containing protein [Candidatus Thermoplasmatota archaeon]|nr:V4R domain-containing protein [Candidatus Thermoplasmatota archaeon]